MHVDARVWLSRMFIHSSPPYFANFALRFIYSIFMSVWPVYTYVCIPHHHTHIWCLQKSEEGIRSGSEVVDS